MCRDPVLQGAYAEWKALQEAKGETAVDRNQFVVDHLLPYWLQCQSCGKWRTMSSEVEVTPEVIRSFHCCQVFSHLEVNNSIKPYSSDFLDENLPFEFSACL